MIGTANQKRFIGLTITCLASIVPLSMLSNRIALGQTVEQKTTFRAMALKVHNNKRSLYPIAALTLAPDTDVLNTGSQAWAEHLALIGKLEHSSSAERNGAGENIAMASDLDSVAPDEVARKAVESWYSEVANYNYAYPLSNSNGSTGHFTQVVWKSTTTLGCGYAIGSQTQNLTYTSTASDGTVTTTVMPTSVNVYYSVCRYNPAGNLQTVDSYTQNVQPTLPGKLGG